MSRKKIERCKQCKRERGKGHKMDCSGYSSMSDTYTVAFETVYTDDGSSSSCSSNSGSSDFSSFCD